MRYAYQIQKLVDKVTNTNRRGLFTYQQNEVSLISFWLSKKKLAQALAQEVKNESYAYKPARQRILITGAEKGTPKERIIYSFELTDKIVGAVIAQWLTELTQAFSSPLCYSYKSGVNIYHVISAFSKFIKQTPKLSPSQRGIYLLKTDIANYTDSIDISESSLIWKELQSIFNSLEIKPSEYQWALIKRTIRPECYDTEKRLQCYIQGIPTGAAITAFLYNFYVSILDHKISSIEGLFYARYSDDILMASANPETLLLAEEQLNQLLTVLKLNRKTAKDLYGYLSPAGNPGIHPSRRWKNTNSFLYLGYQIHGNGRFTVATLLQRRFLKDIQKRIKATYSLVKHLPLEKQGPLICDAVNQAIENNVLGTASEINLIRHSSDYGSLKHLDYIIALRIAEVLSHTTGPRAFRVIPYKTIRSQWLLASLLKLRWHYAQKDKQ